MLPKDKKQIAQNFEARLKRQHLAIGIALFLVLLLVALHRRPSLFGEFSKDMIFGAEVIVIAAFIGFTRINWRCPACNKFLGSGIDRHICRKCRCRLR